MQWISRLTLCRQIRDVLIRHAVLVVIASNTAIAESTSEPLDDGSSWEQGQVLPHFKVPAREVDGLLVRTLPREEQLTYSALQGLVNRSTPRLWFIDKNAEEGLGVWRRTIGLNVTATFNHEHAHTLINKYRDEVNGVVLYDPMQTPHQRNLASTAAGLRNALPVTKQLHDRLAERGVVLPVVEDLTQLRLASALEVYEHIYRTYWPECEKRFLLSASPKDQGGNRYHTRDLAAACGAATLWLDCREPAERRLFNRFLADMPAGESVVLGWHPTERSGVSAASAYGIGTVATDHFDNSTVFCGGDHTIRHPQASPCPPLDNKLYVTFIISDGDNAQYMQHAMRRIWDRSAESRGDVPLSWTVSPAMVDLGPSILNYYYETATENDCFVSGPSGMGYVLPKNTLTEPGAPLGVCMTDPAFVDRYAGLTARYLDAASLRVLTIWDDATSRQREAFEHLCPNLIGATVHNFRDDPSVASSFVNGRLRFERLVSPYASSLDIVSGSLRERVGEWDKESPSFAAYQVNVWSELQPEHLIEFMKDPEHQKCGVVFVRADHFFLLQMQSRGLRGERAARHAR